MGVKWWDKRSSKWRKLCWRLDHCNYLVIFNPAMRQWCAIIPWIYGDEIANNIPKFYTKNGWDRQHLDERVKNWMKFDIIIHMWLRHSNRCSQCSSLQNLKSTNHCNCLVVFLAAQIICKRGSCFSLDTSVTITAGGVIPMLVPCMFVAWAPASRGQVDAFRFTFGKWGSWALKEKKKEIIMPVARIGVTVSLLT